MIDTSASVQTFGPWQKALVVLVLAMHAVKVGLAKADDLPVTLYPADALVAA